MQKSFSFDIKNVSLGLYTNIPIFQFGAREW